jgi:hypothetical protein
MDIEWRAVSSMPYYYYNSNTYTHTTRGKFSMLYNFVANFILSTMSI